MILQKFLFFLLLSCVCLSWDWKELSLKETQKPELRIQKHWLRDTFKQNSLRRDLVNHASPLITSTQVIQGNALDGVKAYDKKRGRWLWSFFIPSGVASPIVEYKDSLYFGGVDGFFYSLSAKTGGLRWKYFSSSKNTGVPLVVGERVYFLTQDQKLYVLNLKDGKLLWLYARQTPSRQFFVQAYPRPVVDKKGVYVSFQDGFVVSLSQKDFSVQWEKKLSQVAIEALELKEGCLLVPVWDTHLLCLNPANGETLWSIKGGSASLLSSSVIYQFYKGSIYAYSRSAPLSQNKPKLLWKKELAMSYPFPPTLVGEDFLVYGSSSKGELQILNPSNGTLLATHVFGKALAGPVSHDQNSLYFFSVSGYLHKISLIK